ncbi:hypothetical protein ACFO5K_12550 [Nocardia halotolerans]|uniref:Tail terminator n=1 Tax=Nocardia halotolerans TaxID=1755878 RepID=A0ABV8VFW1_9NOCA
MTSPYPATGEFPDFEQFLIDLYSPIATTVAELPATGTELDGALPILWVRRLDGSLDENAITYVAQVRIAALAADRAAAAQLAAQAREALLDAPGTDVNGVLIDWARESPPARIPYRATTLQRDQGTTQFPDLDPLAAVVELGFTLHARRQ